MSKFCSLHLRERAVWAYLDGETCRSVGGRFQIAQSAVVNWAALLEPHRDFILARIENTPHLNPR